MSSSVFRFALAPLLALLLMLAGSERLLDVALHNPLLAYANNYDMIRLEACHQVWPADPAIALDRGTPEAPIRFYTRDRHLDTTCFHSSALLFTTAGLGLAEVWRLLSNSQLLDLQMIGLAAALTLLITGWLATLYFLRRRCKTALVGHALVFAAVMCDPGITLYLSTFYSEFAAAYFLYLSLLGLVVLALENWCLRWSVPCLAGLVGLALSKPQHLPLALLMGAMMALYVGQRRRFTLAAVLLGSVVLPALLTATPTWTARDEPMAWANKANVLMALLSTAPEAQRSDILHALQLPDDCRRLASGNWRTLDLAHRATCPEAGELRYQHLVGLLAREPSLPLALVTAAIPRTQKWLIGRLGQVEGRDRGRASEYEWSLSEPIMMLSQRGYIAFFCAPLVAALVVYGWHLFHRRLPNNRLLGATLLAVMQWAVVVIAVIGDGFVDMDKHAHLAGALLLAQVCLWISCLPMHKLLHKIRSLPTDSST